MCCAESLLPMTCEWISDCSSVPAGIAHVFGSRVPLPKL